jgi:hypothetical protein
MRIDVLNNFLGDNPIEIDPDTEDGKQKIAELFMKLLKSGTAIHLERADKTYRVTGYDQETDTIKVMVPIPPRLPLALPLALPPGPEETAIVAAPRFPAACRCERCEGCKNVVGPRSRMGICSACQQGKHGGRKLEAHRGRNRVVSARPRHQRGDRVTAVAPRAGG